MNMNKNMNVEKDFKMYYHTTLRNTGLFTSLSFAALGYSRHYRGKDKLFNVLLIMVSIVFTIITIYISKYLIDDINMLNKEIKTENADKYLLLPWSVYLVSFCLLFLGVYTFIRELMK